MIEDLPARWRKRAAELRALALESEARVFEACASELERRREQEEVDGLTLTEAAKRSGYSYAHLQRLVSRGSLENAGSKRKPRVRPSDLSALKGESEGRSAPGRVEPETRSDLADRVLRARSARGR